MSDIVKRLRAPAYWISGSSEGHEGDNSAPAEAADRIAQLEAALRPFACECVGFCKDAKHNYGEVDPVDTCGYGRARAALGEERT